MREERKEEREREKRKKKENERKEGRRQQMRSGRILRRGNLIKTIRFRLIFSSFNKKAVELNSFEAFFTESLCTCILLTKNGIQKIPLYDHFTSKGSLSFHDSPSFEKPHSWFSLSFAAKVSLAPSFHKLAVAFIHSPTLLDTKRARKDRRKKVSNAKKCDHGE